MSDDVGGSDIYAEGTKAATKHTMARRMVPTITTISESARMMEKMMMLAMNGRMMSQMELELSRSRSSSDDGVGGATATMPQMALALRLLMTVPALNKYSAADACSLRYQPRNNYADHMTWSW